MALPEPGVLPVSDGSEAFVTYGRGILKIFNVAKNFGFISPIFRSEDSEGPPLNFGADEGLWFFGNHRLPTRAVPGIELTFEIWENAQCKAQARNVQVAVEPTVASRPEDRIQEFQRERPPRRHPNEPKVIYPSVYISDVPVEYTEVTIRELHKQLGLNPDAIMGLKYLPFTEISLGVAGENKEAHVTPVTGAVILRYVNQEAANAAVERLKGHPIRTSKGATKYLGAKHAAPAKWVMQRKQEEEDERKQTNSRGEMLTQKVRGAVARVSMAGYGVIKSAEWGEVMWRQYELPTNLRTMQFADSDKFKKEVESRDDYKRLKEMQGKEVEAELYKLPDGQVRAWHVRVVQAGVPSVEGGGSSSMRAFEAPAPGWAEPVPFPPEHTPSSGQGWQGHGDMSQMPPMRSAPHGMQDGSHEGSSAPGMHRGPPMPPHMGGPPHGPGGMGCGPGMGPPPGMGGPPMGPNGMGGPPNGMHPGMPPYADPYYQAQMMQMMQAMHAQTKREKKEKKKDKKDKGYKKEKKEKKRQRSSSSRRSGRSRSPRPVKKQLIDDDDF